MNFIRLKVVDALIVGGITIILSRESIMKFTSSSGYADFCRYCTGNKVKDICECVDRSCPFFPFRRGGLEPEVEADICKKLMKETGMIV